MSKPVYELQHCVEFYETDGAGIVHFSNFFRYMEKCEHAFMRTLDKEVQRALTHPDIGWPRVHAECDYLAPAYFGEVLTIRMFIVETGQRSLTLRFQIHRDAVHIAEGTLIVAFVTKTDEGITAIQLPDVLVEAIEALNS